MGGHDDFFEIWTPGLGYDVNDPGRHLDELDCNPSTTAFETSPRNVVVVIIEEIALDNGVGCTGGGGPSPHCYEVLGFARMYIEGCTTALHGFSPMCDQPGGGGSFTIHARFVQAVGNSTASLGVSRFGDIVTMLRD